MMNKSYLPTQFDRMLFLLKWNLVDLFFWFYNILILYKILWQQSILRVRFLHFASSDFAYALLGSVLITLTMKIIQPSSLGRELILFLKRKPFTLSKLHLIQLLIFSLVTLIAGIYFTQLSLQSFFSQYGFAAAGRIFSSLLTPNFSIFNEAVFSAIESIYMALMATVLAIPISFVFSFFAAQNLTQNNTFLKLGYFCIRFILNVTRAVEPLVWAIIFSVWVGIGPFSGMIALCIHSIAALTKLYSEQIENIDPGPVEAITATGANGVQIIWYAVVPQVFLPFLSFTIYRWDINVRMATVIGLVGGGGIGTLLMQYQGIGKWNEVGLIIIVIAFIVWILDLLSASVRKALI